MIIAIICIVTFLPNKRNMMHVNLFVALILRGTLGRATYETKNIQKIIVTLTEHMTTFFTGSKFQLLGTVVGESNLLEVHS